MKERLGIQICKDEDISYIKHNIYSVLCTYKVAEKKILISTSVKLLQNMSMQEDNHSQILFQ
jgi:rubrerythrin